MITNLFQVTTTFSGADGASEFYFDTEEKAKNFLETCQNGESEAVKIESEYKLNYSDGCTLNDLTFGSFDVKFLS